MNSNIGIIHRRITMLIFFLVFCCGCSPFLITDKMNVYRYPEASKRERLTDSLPVTIYVVKNALKGNVISEPLVMVDTPPHFNRIGYMSFMWNRTIFDNPYHIPPYIVNSARRSARKLGCNSLIIDKAVQSKCIRGAWVSYVFFEAVIIDKPA